jgi:hypothetical protein
LLRIVPVDELEAGLPVALRDGDRRVVGDKTQLALAVAQQILCRLGLTPEQVIGKPIPEVIGDKAWATFAPFFRECLTAESQNRSRQALDEYIWGTRLCF